MVDNSMHNILRLNAHLQTFVPRQELSTQGLLPLLRCLTGSFVSSAARLGTDSGILPVNS
jgi:hypothetical protein